MSDPVKGVNLLGAEVGVEGTPKVTRTDSTGWFRLSDLPLGAVTVKVSYPGYVPVSRKIQLEPSILSRVEFELSDRVAAGREGEVVQLNEFSVSASREMDARTWALEEQRNAANLKRVISSDAFGDDGTGNVGNFLKFFAGVNATGDGGDEPYRVSLRGMPHSSTAYTMNGNPIFNTPESGADRTFTLQEVTLANIARVEVAKSPTPSMWGEFLGGSINLVNKSAFERTKPQLTARVIVDFPGENFAFKSVAGIGNQKSRRFNPGWEVSYIKPVSENFGFTLSMLDREFFSNSNRLTNTFEFAPAAGGSVAAPYLRTIDLREGARLTKEQSYSATADWRPIKPLTLSFSFRQKKSDVYRNPTRVTLNAGTTPASYSDTDTQGRTGAGTLSHSDQISRETGKMRVLGLTATYRNNDWKVELSGSESVAQKSTKPGNDGVFTVSSTFPSATIAYSGFTSELPQTITVRNASGAAVDWGQLTEYQVRTVEDLYRDSETKAPTMRLDVRKALTAWGQPLVVQSGVAFSEQRLTKSENRDRHTYLGPDGVANNADNILAGFVNQAYLGEPIPWANQPAIQWTDNLAIKEYLVRNPNQFVYDQARATTAFAEASEYFKETLSAAYVQGEIRLLQSRFHLTGGVRFERTENYGEGLLNRDGTLILRGTKVSRSYDNWFPSLNATYSIRPSLQLRAAYSKTIGRPQRQYLIPNLIIQDLNDTITLRNKDLKAWTSDNFDLALAWYFGRAGTMSVGVFKKSIANGFLESRFVVDEGLRQQHGLGTEHLGWTLNTTTNSPSKLDLTGVEVDVQTELDRLLPWAKGFSVFANATQLSGTATNGFTEQFPSKKIVNWGVSYSRGRIGGSVNWTYAGKAISSLGAFSPDGQIYIAPLMSVDANVQFRFTKQYRVFANVRNLNRQPAERYYEGTGLAGYAGRIVARKDLASIRWTVGVAGEF